MMNRFFKRFTAVALALVMIVTIYPSHKAESAENYNGGWVMSYSTQTVWNSSDPSVATKIGTIYANEGITMLWQSSDGYVAKIEYSTSNGTKTGFLFNPNIYKELISSTSVAQVNVTSTVYYGEDFNTYAKVGTVYAGEFVTVFGTVNGVAYIEYNTSSGRKRGYMSEYNMEMFYWGRLGTYPKYRYGSSPKYISGTKNVYAGPTKQYPIIGSVSNEWVTRFDAIPEVNLSASYIEYYINGTSQKKSGFILD